MSVIFERLMNLYKIYGHTVFDFFSETIFGTEKEYRRHKSHQIQSAIYQLEREVKKLKHTILEKEDLIQHLKKDLKQAYEQEQAHEEYTYKDFEREWEEEQRQRQSQQQSKGINLKLAQYYANLEIPFGSDLNTIKTAWKTMMKKYHPDLHSNDKEKQETAKILATELTHAYQELQSYIKVYGVPKP